MSSKLGWRAHAVSLVLVAPLLLAACGDEAAPSGADDAASESRSSEASPSDPAAADAPDCEEIWQEGAKIPRGYSGCLEDGELVERDVVSCSSGQRMVRYADRFYGVLGGTVHETAGPLEADRGYRAAIRSCTA